MLEYFLSKVFVILECYSNKLSRIENKSKQRIHDIDMHDSDYIMTCTTWITSISNTLKNLCIQSDLYSYYIQTIYNGKEEIINNIFSPYVETLLDDINYPALLQEYRLNIDAKAYEKKSYAKVNRPSDKK